MRRPARSSRWCACPRQAPAYCKTSAASVDIRARAGPRSREPLHRHRATVTSGVEGAEEIGSQPLAALEVGGTERDADRSREIDAAPHRDGVVALAGGDDDGHARGTEVHAVATLGLAFDLARGVDDTPGAEREVRLGEERPHRT